MNTQRFSLPLLAPGTRMRHSLSRKSGWLVDIPLLRVTSSFVFVVELHDHFTVFGFEAHADGQPVRYQFSGHCVEGFDKGFFFDGRDIPLYVDLIASVDEPGFHAFGTGYLKVNVEVGYVGECRIQR